MDHEISAPRAALNPQHFVPHADIEQVYAPGQHYTEAIAEVEHAVMLSARSPEELGLLGNVYVQAGRRAQAQPLLAELQRMPKEESAAPMDFVLGHIGLGSHDEAFAWLDKRLAARDSGLFYLKVEPRFDSLRREPHCQQLLCANGLATL